MRGNPFPHLLLETSVGTTFSGAKWSVSPPRSGQARVFQCPWGNPEFLQSEKKTCWAQQRRLNEGARGKKSTAASKQLRGDRQGHTYSELHMKLPAESCTRNSDDRYQKGSLPEDEAVQRQVVLDREPIPLTLPISGCSVEGTPVLCRGRRT